MTTQPGDPETPIEREDGPDAEDVPPGDPSGRVDAENLDSAPADVDSSTLPLDGDKDDSAAP